MNRSRLPQSLVELAQIFAPIAPLYVVGGAVRNALLGYPIEDFDLASAVPPEDVERLLEGSDFCVTARYKRTGTLIIEGGGNKFEYTTFRSDSYPLQSGQHSPEACVFTDDIRVDCLRRDFTCNALYYDITADKVVDLVGGRADIERRVLRTVREPAATLSEDGLRIMRLVRFSVQLGFGIDGETLGVAKQCSKLLKEISKERIKDELVLIFEGVFKYNSQKLGVKPSDGIRLLVQIGAMQYIIPEVCQMVGVQQNAKYHIYDVFDHTMATIDNLPPELMMAGLLHDVAKPELNRRYGNMYMHELHGEKMSRRIMSDLKFSNAEIGRVSRLVAMHMFNVDGATRQSKCRVFIADNWQYFDDFIALRRADGMATNPANYDDSTARKMLQLREEMIADKMPITISQLPVDGNDLISLGYSGKEIGDKLASIRLWILQNGKTLTRQSILDALKLKNMRK